MCRLVSPEFSVRAAGKCRLLLPLVAVFVAPGCHRDHEIDFAADTKPPPMRLTQPQARNIVRIIGQPSFIESYERTSIYPKPTAYIEKWNVDIGDKVKKVDVLATLFAPELVEELQTKKANVLVDRQRIALAKELVEVAKADVEAAKARVSEAEAILNKYQSEVDRWDTEVKRLEKQVADVVVNRQVLIESTNQLRSAIGARDQAKATIKRAKAELRASEAKLAKAQVDVRVAEAALTVALSEEQYAKAWVDYLTLTAPFAGVISVRNANTFDFVLPTTGDPTAFYLSPDISPGKGAAPIYVVDRLDVVRIFVDIAEHDANFVTRGTKATVLARAFRDKEFPATVTRISWALNQKSRTLRAEIDLRNPNSQLLPGMYAYVNVIIERPDVRALPVDALTYSGDQAFCWLYENGKAVKAELETGVSDDNWIEVTNRRPPVAPEDPSDSVPWTAIDGREQVILGELASLFDGAPVQVTAASTGTKLASEGSVPDDPPARAVAEPAPGTAKVPSSSNGKPESEKP
jgi:multidrug efflux pump subunit AcrA (membrane-fusion protein)